MKSTWKSRSGGRQWQLPWWSVPLLMLPLYGWVWQAAREPCRSVFDGGVPAFVLTGRVFTEPFNTVHAGFVMDQPTIGKWLFWFRVMTATTLPLAVAICRLTDRTTWAGRLACGIFCAVLATMWLCILSWPLCWLVQYLCSLEPTTRRLAGLAYALAGGLAMVGFAVWSFRPAPSGPFSSDRAGGGPAEPGIAGPV
jgi:hypothetical protein